MGHDWFSIPYEIGLVILQSMIGTWNVYVSEVDIAMRKEPEALSEQLIGVSLILKLLLIALSEFESSCRYLSNKLEHEVVRYVNP